MSLHFKQNQPQAVELTALERLEKFAKTYNERSNVTTHSDFNWPFLRPYMGVIPNQKMAFIFTISCILALIFPILIKYFPKCEEKGSFQKSQIKSLTQAPSFFNGSSSFLQVTRTTKKA